MTTRRCVQFIGLVGVLVAVFSPQSGWAGDHAVAIVEDTSGATPGVEPLDLLPEGREISLQPDSPTSSASYNAWYSVGASATKIAEIEVRYYDSSTEDFRLRGTTTDGKKLEIFSIEHVDSNQSNSRATWAYSGASDEIIDWTFKEPEIGHWVSWKFNPSGTTPPVKVKVVLRRQS